MRSSGDSIVVGAVTDDGGSGAAYVFDREAGGHWSEKAKLQRDPEAASAQLGWSVAIHRDTVVVGAPRNTNDPGEAHVFERTSDGWKRSAVLTASVGSAKDFFGIGVALTDNALVVGAYGDNSSGRGLGADTSAREAPLSGAAYLYVRSDEGYRLSTYLKASNAKAQDGFGVSVAASEDLLVVGAAFEASSATGIDANGDDRSSTRAGAAYIFH